MSTQMLVMFRGGPCDGVRKVFRNHSREIVVPTREVRGSAVQFGRAIYARSGWMGDTDHGHRMYIFTYQHTDYP